MSTLFLLVVLGAMLFVAHVHAYGSGVEDARDIKLDKPIDHPAKTKMRLVGMSALMTLLWAFGWMISENWSAVLLFLPTVWAMWNISFRLTLNKERELDWWYMGSMLEGRTKNGSRYDTVFHFFAWAVTGFKRTMTYNFPTYPVRLPAILTYAFEVAVGLVGIWLAGRSVFGG